MQTAIKQHEPAWSACGRKRVEQANGSQSDRPHAQIDRYNFQAAREQSVTLALLPVETCEML